MNKRSCVYVIPFKINNWQLPVRVQVSFARDFSRRNNIDFSLPKSELLFSRKYKIFESLLEDKFSDIIIFSELLIAHKKSLEILKSLNFSNDKKDPKPKFHLTYSDETISLNHLIIRIEKIIRNKKYAMSYENLKIKKINLSLKN